MSSYMLGIDIGTTSTKAVLFTEKRRSHSNREYWLSTSHTGYIHSGTRSRRDFPSCFPSDIKYNETAFR